MRERLRDVIGQTCAELNVQIIKGVLARDHVHMFINVPPKLALATVMQRIKGRSSRRIQMEFPDLRKRYWGGRFWARGYFSTTSGNVTGDIILQYLELHSKRDATGISR
jgi:REP-associated tyrosine transposase